MSWLNRFSIQVIPSDGENGRGEPARNHCITARKTRKKCVSGLHFNLGKIFYLVPFSVVVLFVGSEKKKRKKIAEKSVVGREKLGSRGPGQFPVVFLFSFVSCLSPSFCLHLRNDGVNISEYYQKNLRVLKLDDLVKSRIEHFCHFDQWEKSVCFLLVAILKISPVGRNDTKLRFFTISYCRQSGCSARPGQPDRFIPL